MSSAKLTATLATSDPDIRRVVLVQSLIDHLVTGMSPRTTSTFSEASQETVAPQSPAALIRPANHSEADTQPTVEGGAVVLPRTSSLNRGTPSAHTAQQSSESVYHLAKETVESEKNDLKREHTENSFTFPLPLPRPPTIPPPQAVKDKNLPIPPPTNEAEETLTRKTSKKESSSFYDTDMHIPPRTTSQSQKRMMSVEDAEFLITAVNNDLEALADRRQTAGLLFTDNELDDLFRKFSAEESVI
jgi:hypothetical protein